MEYPPKHWLTSGEPIVETMYHIVAEKHDDMSDFIEYLQFIRRVPEDEIVGMLNGFLEYSRLKSTCAEISDACTSKIVGDEHAI